jgi:WD40 repeat protein
VISDFEFRVLILDAQTGRVAGSVLHHGEHVVFAGLSPQGDRVLSVCQDGTTRVWQLPEEKPPVSWVTLDFQSKGQRALIMTNGQLETIGLPAGDLTEAMRGSASHPHAIARLLSDGRSCATLSEVVEVDPEAEPMRWLKSFDLVSPGTASITLQLPVQFDRMAVMIPASAVAVWSTNVVMVHDLKGGRLVWSVEFGGMRVLQVFPDLIGQRLAVALSAKGRQLVQLLDSFSGRALWPGPVAVSGEVKSIRFSADGRFVAVACSSSSARSEVALVFESSSGRPVGEPMVHRDGVLYADFSPRGHQVVTCGEDKTALIWSLETGQQLVRPLLHGDQVARAAFSPDGRWLVTLCRNQVLQVWDVSTGDAITPPIPVGAPCSQVAFSEHAEGVWTWSPASATQLGAVSWIPLRRESRSLEDLSALSRVLSAQHYHYSGALMPSPRELLRDSWKRIR